MVRLLALSLVFVSVLGSCDFMGERIRGNGAIKTETRPAEGFSEVRVSHNMELHITQGAFEPVRIETDENLMSYIEVHTHGNVLEIGSRDNANLDPSGKIKIFVSAPSFDGFKASGACQIIGDTRITSTEELSIDVSGASGAKLDLKAPAVSVDLSGSSSVNLIGETRDLQVDASGASEVRNFDLMAENVDVELSGACNADVYASKLLKASASGASNIRYRGEPSVDQHTSGASNVNRAK